MGTKIKFNQKTYKIKVLGIVQGVGFRPFIYNLANELKIEGCVLNTTEGVLITATGEPEIIKKFIRKIKDNKPAPSVIESIELEELPLEKFDGFNIKKSSSSTKNFQLISPDLATCSECIKDINNPKDKRRYLYPFTNCTNCGPRFTIIDKLPYDRPNTTMRIFKQCKECEKEYNNPRDRRFHAQPIACNNCGPRLSIVDSNGKKIKTSNPISLASKKIMEGKIIGIKSLGGFQLACDATSDKAVKKLRKRKNRPFKPFAVMLKNTETVKIHYKVSEKEIKSLNSPKAPIVLIKKDDLNYLSKSVSFYNKYEGIMLPYTPIHHLLFKYLDIPLIMTSGNITEEPIASQNNEAIDKLNKICDFFLLHDRDIYSRYDDSVVKIFDDNEMLLRRARGYSPYPVKLKKDIKDKTILAMGPQEKNTFCIYKKNYGIVSQHLGDLDSVETNDFFKETINIYRDLFNIENIDIVAIDKHPGYNSTKFAKKFSNITKKAFQHHKAHIASVMAENKIGGNLLGFSWDGTGYGDDGKIWGSEIFLVKDNSFSRIGHLQEKYIPGGEISIKKPYRMSLSYLYKYFKLYNSGSSFIDFIYDNFGFYKKILSEAELDIIASQAETGYNSPATTSMGRFFDSISSILNLTHINSFEGEAAIHLEMSADSSTDDSYDITINDTENIIIDEFIILGQIIKDLKNGLPSDIIAAKFHNTLVDIIVKISKIVRDNYGIFNIALSGGVFQNNLLLERSFYNLKKNGFKVFSNFKVPVNDGGISLGQAYLASYHL